MKWRLRPPPVLIPYRLSHHEPFPGSIVVPDRRVQSFNSRVLRRESKDDCWLYQPLPRTFRDSRGRILVPNPNRYFVFSWVDRSTGLRQAIPAHRLALLQAVGPRLLEGKFACHLCATSACMNPNHLYPGTPQENSADRELMADILAAQGTTEGVVLPQHPRSRLVCEALINGQDVAPIIEQEQARLAPSSGSLSIGSFRDASVPLPSPRLRPARDRGAAQIQ